MKRALIFASALLPASAMGAPSGIAWTNGKRLDAAALQQFDNLKANQSAADALQASKLNRSGDTSTNQTLNGSTMNMGALHGTVVDDGTYTAAASGQKRSLASRLNDAVYLKDFGAKCDGSTDDTLAIQAWIAYAAGKSYAHLVAPAGVCVFTQPLSIQSGDNFHFEGAGQKTTTFLYEGIRTTESVMTFAGTLNVNPNTHDWENWYVGKFRVLSNTKMTAGAAVVFNRLSESKIDGIEVGDMDNAPKNFHDGIWFNGIHVIMFNHYAITAQHDGLIVNDIDGYSNTNIWIGDGYSDYNGRYGLLIGGGIGGVFCDRSEFMGNNGANIAITNEKSTNANREIFFGNQVVSDGLQSGSAANAAQFGIYVNAPQSPGALIVIDADLVAAVRDSVELVACPSCVVIVGAPRISFNRRDGIRYSDASITLTIGGHTLIDLNGGYAVNATVPTTSIFSQAVIAASNTLGGYSAGSNVGAWKNWTPGVSASSGSLGGYTVNFARYKVLGRTVSFTVSITVNDAGTGSGGIAVDLPALANNSFVVTGRANGMSGQQLQGFITGGTMYVYTSVGAYPAPSGETLVLSGTYESAQP